MRAAPSNGSSDLLQLVLTAAQEMSRHEDPAEVTRIALAHGRKILRFDRSLAATRRDMNAGTIRITRSDEHEREQISIAIGGVPHCHACRGDACVALIRTRATQASPLRGAL